jgi:hypothetical protein
MIRHILYSQLFLWVPSGSLSRCLPITSPYKSSFPTFQLHVQLIVAYHISLSKSILDDVDKAISFSLRSNLKYPFTSYVVGLNTFQDKSKTWYVSSVYESYTIPRKELSHGTICIITALWILIFSFFQVRQDENSILKQQSLYYFLYCIANCNFALPRHWYHSLGQLRRHFKSLCTPDNMICSKIVKDLCMPQTSRKTH